MPKRPRQIRGIVQANESKRKKEKIDRPTRDDAFRTRDDAQTQQNRIRKSFNELKKSQKNKRYQELLNIVSAAGFSRDEAEAEITQAAEWKRRKKKEVISVKSALKLKASSFLSIMQYQRLKKVLADEEGVNLPSKQKVQKAEKELLQAVGFKEESKDGQTLFLLTNIKEAMTRILRQVMMNSSRKVNPKTRGVKHCDWACTWDGQRIECPGKTQHFNVLWLRLVRVGKKIVPDAQSPNKCLPIGMVPLPEAACWKILHQVRLRLAKLDGDHLSVKGHDLKYQIRLFYSSDYK